MIQNVPRPGGFLSLFRRAFAVLLFGFVLLAGASPGFAQDSGTPALAAEAESLIQALVALNARYQLAGPAERSELLDELERVAAERQQLLASFIQDHSDEVLRLALPQGLRSSLPDQVQAYLEEQQTVEGELEVLHVDHKDPRKSHYGYFLTTPSGKRFSLHFVANPPGLLSGAKVRVHGVFLKTAGPADLTAGAMAVPDGVTNVETLAAGGTSGSTSTTSALTTVLPSTFGAQKTLVILVNFQDKATQPYTPDTARNIVFNTTSNFDLENSFQQAWLTGDVYGWYTIALDSTVCDSRQIASYAKQAATAAGVNLSAYTRHVYAFPDNACDWWGLGTVGGNPSQAWINGSLAKGVGHEMGHNLGLYHSRGLECGPTTLGSNCTTIEYGDTLDKMGGTAAGHFNAFQKERLGWLNSASSPPILTVQADGTYWLEPYETGPGVDPKALKILKSVDPTMGTKTWYYVEYRQAVGFDSFLSSNGNVLNGVVVHTGTENSGNSSGLLDMTPATSSWNDPALEIGQSFYDPDAGVTIAPTWANGSNAQVSVSIGPLGCAPTNPALAVSPSQSQWDQAGATVTYTVTLTNKDNARCSESSFNLHAGVPSGWTAAFASTMLTLDPGASASTTLTVTSSASAADGFYTIPVAATNGADMNYTASASATVVIAASLNVAVPTNQPSYTPNQSVTPTAQVHGNGSPVPNTAASPRAVTIPVTISPGSSIQSAINANPNGTIFNLAAGTWTNQQFTPKPGNQFIGAPGGTTTILTGSDSVGGVYSSDGTVNIPGVLLKDFVIEHYDAPHGPSLLSSQCGGGAIHGANGWTFENMTFRLNNCVGLNMGPNSMVTGGKYIDNGHAGIQGGPAHNSIVQGAEIARNNTNRGDPEWDAAGVKFAITNNSTFRNNYVHDNYGPGLWCDINCTNTLIEGNTVVNNFAAGIWFEISPGPAIIRNNVSNNNASTLLGRPQIYVASSNHAEVYGNNVKSSNQGAGLLMQAAARGDELITSNNFFHNNVVTMTNNNSRYGLSHFGGTVGSGNSSNNNQFCVGSTAYAVFYWDASFGSNFTSYKTGHDAASTIQVGDCSVAGNTLGCPALTGCAGTSDTTPPTVSLTAPTNGSTVSGSSVAVSANASDNVGVASVEFKVDGTTLSMDTTSPYAVSWNTTGATNASHTLTAVARDAAANTMTSVGVTVTVNNTTSPPPPTTNLALNKPVTASSIYSSSFPASFAVDGNTGTRWSSAFSNPQWIRVDLGSLKQINRVVLKWEAAYGKSYKIQLSSDNVNWTDIYSTTAGTGGVNSLTVSGTGRYLRMYGTVRGTPYGYSLWEMEAYGSDAASPPASPVPDVIVTALSYTNGIFTSTVKNQGTAATPTGVSIGVAYSVDDVYRTWGAVVSPPLAAGASATVGTDGGTYNIPFGTHTITAHVDDVNRFTESNENNNKFSITVSSSDTTPPTVSLTAPTNGSTVSGSSVAVSAGASDNVGVASVDFKVDGTTFSTDTTSPYAVSWNTTGATNASHTLTAVARDAAGNTTTSSGVTVTVSNTVPGTQSPYGGTAVVIPGTIQAEGYDNGGEGVAYHDSDSANNGGLYRPNESVDIKAASDTGGGYAIGWILQPNEWFEYTVNVASSGTFTFAARVATIYSGKRFHVEIDGVNVTGSLGVPVTGSAWDTTWGTVTKSGINLTAGPHIMRVVADTDLFDLNYFTWTPINKFVIGDPVKANVGLTVRSKPSTSSSSTIRGTQPTGALGRIIGGPQIGSGYTWWQVDFDSGADGWVVQSGIIKQ